ncbi:MAG: hypothetical protein RBT36_07140 [Desulfobulbus sp.]|jgi:hypothetical protein|nr:hypothetical protein [Candidatus Cloacimonadota bacterium]MDX9834979.1 hypothetical protein [Desulfobulbus sp.]NLN85878.1 hypothetical protein [Candidatus Cloacimonadota bacterium]
MRAFFKNMIQAYRGKCDGLIYYYNPRINRIVVRSYAKPRETANNRRFSAIATNLRALEPSDAYKNDLSVYADTYSRKTHRCGPTLANWYNVYVKVMYAMAKANPAIDLVSLTRADIEDGALPCRSVKQAVEAGLLEPVVGWERLTAGF